MRIAYVHGFASSGQTKIVDVLRKYLPDDEIVAYDMPINPREAIDFLIDKLYEDDVKIAIGTSLGAYYVLHTLGCWKIAINPPFNPNTVLDNFIGEDVEFLNPRKDGAASFIWDKDYHGIIEYYNEHRIDSNLDALNQSYLYFGTEDDFVTDNELYDDYWNKTYIPGGHRFTEDMLVNFILPKIEELKER